jgi:Sel1 repeat
MRILIAINILFLTAGLSLAQTENQSKCKVQDLAVDAALGDPIAQYDLGVAFYQGVDVPQDFSKAATMWRLSSSAGVVASHNNLGYLTYYGKGVKQDFAEGLRLWRIAAEKGFPESQVHIGYAYSDNKYLKRDYVEAFAWIAAGKHYASKASEAEILEMAENRLAEVRRMLARSQIGEAEKKAAEYIAKYVPK